LNLANIHKAQQRGLDYEYDVKLEQAKTKEELILLQAKKELGLDSDGKSSSKTNGIPTAELLQPTGATAEQSIPQNENKEGMLKNNIKELRNQNKEQFTELVSNMFAEKLGSNSPVLKLLETQTKEGGMSKGVFDRIKETPAFKALDNKVKSDLANQYVALNKAYTDVLDGKADKYDGWQFTPKTQAAMKQIQLRSMNATVAENRLKEAQTKAETEIINKNFKGNRKAYLEARKTISRSEFNYATGSSLNTTKESSATKLYKEKMEAYLADTNLYQERPYVINKDQIGKERYGAIEGKVASLYFPLSFPVTGFP